MKTLTYKKTLTHETDRAISSGPSDGAGRAGLLHERAVLSARLARLLRRSLRGLDWAGLPDADSDGLERALTALGGDIPLVWLIRSQDAFAGGMTVSGANEVRNADTAKAAPAASPSRRGSESSDGSAAFLGHPAPAGEP